MILSSNSIEFALLSMAAMQARAPLAPVSPAYSVMSQDHAKLKYVFDLIKPGLVFVQNGEIYADALAALDLEGVLLVHVDKAPPKMQSLPWSELVATKPTDAVAEVDRADRAQDRRQVPVHLGQHRHAQGGDQHPGDDVRQPGDGPDGARAQARPIPCRCMLDWLPWNHTMGGNATFQGNLAEGGTTWIDDGKPLPGLFEETLRNLREISPTYFANVPAGYAMLATALEKDESLAQKFFKNLNSLAYGGATLPSDLYERMERLAVKHTGYRLPFVTGWGSTETAPTATTVHWASERVGLIGLPFPGVQLKMVPTGEEGRYELRLKSVIVTPGYYKRPDLTAQMFDEEGFYKIGDAGRFVDPDGSEPGPDLRRPRGRGLQADERHLRAGRHLAQRRRSRRSRRCCRTPWSAARTATMSACWASPTSPPAARVAGDEDVQLTTAEVLAHPAVVDDPASDGLAAMNAEGKGSSMQVQARAADGPSRRRSTATRSPTRATSTSAPRSSGARRWSTGSMPAARA